MDFPSNKELFPWINLGIKIFFIYPFYIFSYQNSITKNDCFFWNVSNISSHTGKMKVVCIGFVPFFFWVRLFLYILRLQYFFLFMLSYNNFSYYFNFVFNAGTICQSCWSYGKQKLNCQGIWIECFLFNKLFDE